MLNLQGHRDRQKSRMDGLQALFRAESELRAVLQSAVEQLKPPPRPAAWMTILQRLGLIAVPKPVLAVEEELWRHHEATLQQVRALGHHLDMFQHDQHLLEADICQLSEASQELAQQRGSLRALLSSARASQNAREEGRLLSELEVLTVTEDEVHQLLSRHQTMQVSLDGMLAVLSSLHDRGEQATRELAEQFAELADQIAEQVGQRAIGQILDSLGELALVVDSSALSLSRDLDSLSEKLSALDEEARQRSAARAEVEHTRLR